MEKKITKWEKRKKERMGSQEEAEEGRGVKPSGPSRQEMI